MLSVHCLCESGMSCATEQLCNVQETTVWGLWNLICSKTNIGYITAHRDLYLPIRFNIIPLLLALPNYHLSVSPPSPPQKKSFSFFTFSTRVYICVLEQNCINSAIFLLCNSLIPPFPTLHICSKYREVLSTFR